jgi:hypothetical protein
VEYAPHSSPLFESNSPLNEFHQKTTENLLPRMTGAQRGEIFLSDKRSNGFVKDDGSRDGGVVAGVIDMHAQDPRQMI